VGIALGVRRLMPWPKTEKREQPGDRSA